MRILVDDLSEVFGDGSPVRFRLGQRTIEVIDVLDRWQGTTTEHFRVRGSDEHTYVLRRDRTAGTAGVWEMVSYTHKNSQGTAPGSFDRNRLLH
jgi:hypothetical protein